MNLDEQIKKVMDNKVYKVQADLVRATAVRVADNASKMTPVDTGRAKANWNLSAERPDYSTTESTTPQSYNEDDFTGKEKALYVTNGLPYIMRLNEGSSVQAPSNFVEQATMLAIRQAEAAVKRGVR